MKIFSAVIISFMVYLVRDNGSLVTTAWRVLRFRMRDRPPIWRVAANIFNKHSLTADKGWSSSLVFGRGAKYSAT